jgi:hypothetical protein
MPNQRSTWRRLATPQSKPARPEADGVHKVDFRGEQSSAVNKTPRAGDAEQAFEDQMLDGYVRQS